MNDPTDAFKNSAHPARVAADFATAEPDDWVDRLHGAVRRKLPGDILTWAEETSSPARALLARRSAGRLLLESRQVALALEQFELALQIDPNDTESADAGTSCRQQLQASDADAVSADGIEAGPGPRQVLLFTGHRIDPPGRALPRFTPAMQPAASSRIAEELKGLHAGPQDLALCQAAAGGDLLFLECCHALGVPCRVLLPFEEAYFIEQSILASIDGRAWLSRWLALKGKLSEPAREMPIELGPAPDGIDLYERCNRWLLNTALACSPDKPRLLCLWNGMDGDGRGGVKHMVDAVRHRGGTVHWIDTRELGQPRISSVR